MIQMRQGKTETCIRLIANGFGQKVSRVYLAHNGWTISIVDEPYGYRLGCWKNEEPTIELGYGTMEDIETLVRLVWEQPK